MGWIRRFDVTHRLPVDDRCFKAKLDNGAFVANYLSAFLNVDKQFNDLCDIPWLIDCN